MHGIFLPENSHVPLERPKTLKSFSDIRRLAGFYDPFPCLSALAVLSDDLKLGTSVCLLTQRMVPLIAGSIETMQRLSGERFIFGVAGGFIREAMENHGSNFQNRWGIVENSVTELKRDWVIRSGDEKDIIFPPVWIGSNSRKVPDRVARYADGWMTRKTLYPGNAIIDLLENDSNFDFEIVDDLSKENLKNKIKDCDGVSLRTAKLNDEIISAGKKLKIISRHGVGYDNIDLNTAKKNNITIAITATANAVAVSEHVMFMLLNIAKRKSMYDDSVKSGNFINRNKLPKTMEIWKKNILIAGFGRIGQNLIKRCLGFEMNVFVYDPFVDSEKIISLGGKKVDNLVEAVQTMDAISLHVPLNDKTKNLINISLLKTMKKNCILINAARGGIVNENDLNLALNDGLIYGAGLDVFSKEPPDENNPLLKNDKVFLSPHTSAFTEECMQRMAKETIQNIIDFFDNKLDKSKIVKI